MDERSDAALVRETLGGRREAFAILVRRYQDCAYGTAIGILADFDLARDAVQESFVCAFRDLRRLRDPARFAGWLRGIVRHMAHRAARELAAVRSLAEALGGAAEAAAPAPDESAETAEQRRIVRAALRRLSEKNREAVSLYYVNGLSYADIAEYLGVTEATVQGRLQRGRAELRKEFAMVEKAYRAEELPDGFADEIRRLLDAVADSRRREGDAVRRLAEIGAPAVEPLCEALGDPRRHVRRAAASALCAIGEERALRPILRLLYSRYDWALNRLCRDGRILRIPGLKDELLRALDREPEGDHYLTLMALANAVGDDAVYRRLLEIFRGRGQGPLHKRRQALAALCSVRPQEAPHLVREAMEDPDIGRSSGWAWWIALREGFVLPVETCLKGFGRDVAPISRSMAAHLVLRHGEAGRRVLEDLLERGRPEERATAALGLAAGGRHPRAFAVLLNELLAGRGQRKWTHLVTRTLVRCYGDRLLAWADAHPDHPRSQPLEYALAKARLAAGAGTPADQARFGAPSARATAVRQQAAQQGAAAIPDLRRHLREGKPGKVAQEAWRQMLRLGAAAEAAADEMLASPHWTERKAAASLLRRWGKLTPDRQARAAADPHIAVRHAARPWPYEP